MNNVLTTPSCRPGECVGAAAPGKNEYALVAYIPGPLGQYLDALRQELVPGCRLRSQVSVLPPRPLTVSPEEAEEEIRRWARASPGFSLELTEVRVFPETSVIYLELGAGRDELVRSHDRLNGGRLAFAERYHFHPHVTLAQDFPPEQLPELRRRAEQRWRECPYPRVFPIESVTFVQNTNGNGWVHLSDCRLGAEASPGPPHASAGNISI
jgi:hypothetical protein